MRDITVSVMEGVCDDPEFEKRAEVIKEQMVDLIGSDIYSRILATCISLAIDLEVTRTLLMGHTGNVSIDINEQIYTLMSACLSYLKQPKGESNA